MTQYKVPVSLLFTQRSFDCQLNCRTIDTKDENLMKVLEENKKNILLFRNNAGGEMNKNKNYLLSFACRGKGYYIGVLPRKVDRQEQTCCFPRANLSIQPELFHTEK